MLPLRWLRRSLLALLLLLLLAGTALLYARHWLTQQGVSTLDWQGLQLARSGLQLDRLELQQRDPLSGRQLRLQLAGLQLDWTLWPFQLQRLSSQQLGVQLLDAGQPAPATPAAAFSLPVLPDWLPLAIALPAIDLDAPCPAGRCTLQGALQGQRAAGALLPASLELQLQDGSHSARLQAQLGRDAVQTRLQLDQQDWLQLDGQRAQAGPPLQLHGRLQLPARAPAPWLTDWLQPWSPAAATALRQLPDALQASADWRLQLQQDAAGQWQLPALQLDLQAALPLWQQDGLRLRDSRLQLALTGSWQDGRLQLAGAADSRLQIGQLDHAGSSTSARALRLEPGALQLPHSAAGLQAGGSLQLVVGELRHPQLRRQGWRLQLSQPEGAPGRAVRLTLDNDAGLRWQGRLDLAADGSLQLDGALAALDLAHATPLTATLRQWPDLLEVSAGRLTLDTRARRSASGQLGAEASLLLDGVAGIWDRSALGGLNARLHASLDGERLRLRIPLLQVAEINPGLPIGPLQLEAEYRASLGAPLGGQLRIDLLETSLLKGRLRLIPGQIDFGALPQQFALAAYGLDIAELLRLYPAEGLQGSGLLDGYLPVRLSREGIEIRGGNLMARAPGGVLQLRSPGIINLGRSNQAMQLVATALDDFRYAVLASRFELSPSGQMLLGLTLSGHNPALERGRMVNLNINLEEDLPALLTNLQLAGKVNDRIRERLQQRLQPAP